MTKAGFSDLMAGLDVLLTGPLDERTTALYLEALEDIPDRDAAMVAKQCVRDWSKFPKPAQIRKSAEKIGVTFRGSRPVAGVDGSNPLPRPGTPEWREGKARGGLMWALLGRVSVLFREVNAGEFGDQIGPLTAQWLGNEPRILRGYVRSIVSGRSTVDEMAREAIEAYRGLHGAR